MFSKLHNCVPCAFVGEALSRAHPAPRLTGRVPATRCYRLHGLHILSPLRLGGDEVPHPPDDSIALIIGPAGALESVPPDARVLSRFEFSGGATCSHVQTARGFLSTYFDKAQFHLSPDRSTIRVRLAPGLEPDWVKVFMAASYPAFLLFLAGRVPLHASAVWLPKIQGAVAVLGSAGAGKSTLAGALCLAGGRLISDDLVSFNASAQALNCEAGSRQLRLRQTSDELAARFTPERITASSDGRCVVDAREELRGDLPLKALIQPVLDREATSIRLEKLSATAAFQAVACDPRIKGLTDPAWVKAAFDHAGRLARKVPVWRATVPFRERHFRSIGESLMESLLNVQAE